MSVDKIAKLISIGSSLLIIMGVLKLYIYYDQFGIRINEYISLQEVIISFVDDLVEFSVYIGATILMSYFVFREIDDLIEIEEVQKRVEVTNRLKSLQYIISILFIAGINIYLIVDVFRKALNNQETINLILIALESYLFLSLSLFLFNRIINSNRSKKPISIFIIVVLVLVINSAIEDSEKVKQFNGSIEYKFYLDNKTIDSGSDVAYIGKTKDYLFLFYKEEGAKIYPISRVKGVEARIK